MTTRRRATLRRLRAPALAGAALVVTLIGSGTDGPPAALDAAPTILGSAPGGTTGDPGESWALDVVDPSGPPRAANGRPLAVDSGADTQLALMRYTATGGWRHVETPVDKRGAPYGGLAFEASSRGVITRRGGVAFVVEDPSRTGARRRVLLHRPRADPQKADAVRLRAAPHPPVLRPAAPDDEPELLSGTVGAVADEGEATVAYVAPSGPATVQAMLRYDGQAWSREPICVGDRAGELPIGCGAPARSEPLAAFEIVSVVAAERCAWLVGRGPDGAPRLFRRDGATVPALWRAVPLPAPIDGRGGLSSVRPRPTADALTASGDAVWLDGTAVAGRTAVAFTTFLDADGAVTWCDAPGCAERLDGLEFCEGVADTACRGGRTRSFAWSGDGRFGARVLVGARDARAGADRPYVRLTRRRFEVVAPS